MLCCRQYNIRTKFVKIKANCCIVIPWNWFIETVSVINIKIITCMHLIYWQENAILHSFKPFQPPGKLDLFKWAILVFHIKWNLSIIVTNTSKCCIVENKFHQSNSAAQTLHNLYTVNHSNHAHVSQLRCILFSLNNTQLYPYLSGLLHWHWVNNIWDILDPLLILR